MKERYKYIIFFVLSGIIGLINGLFGGGGGVLCIPVLKKLLKMEDKEAHATAVLVMAIISIPTLIVYLSTLQFDLSELIFVTIGTLIGGGIGVLLLKKFSNKIINILYIVVLFLCALKCFF